MIKLEVQPYCNLCFDFEPDVTKPERVSICSDFYEQEVLQTDTIVKCKYTKRCENIRRYLKQQLKEDQ